MWVCLIPQCSCAVDVTLFGPPQTSFPPLFWAKSGSLDILWVANMNSKPSLLAGVLFLLYVCLIVLSP